MTTTTTAPLRDMAADAAVPTVSVPEEITCQWLSAALGTEVRSVNATAVGTGQIGTCYRLTVDADNMPSTMIAKLPVADPDVRPMLHGPYRSEVTFYSQIAPTVDITVPTCYFAQMGTEPGEYTLILEDLDDLHQGNQLAGSDLSHAEVAVTELAGLHAAWWNDHSLLDIEGMALADETSISFMGEIAPGAFEDFRTELGDHITQGAHRMLERIPAYVERWMRGRSRNLGLVHGDFRLDNMMVTPIGADTQGGPPRVVSVDWQTLSPGVPARDLAFFISTGLDPVIRREHERDLVAKYHQRLVEYGINDYSLQECWDDYRFSILQGPAISIFGWKFGTRSARGDAMFCEMVNRSSHAAEELGTLELIDSES